MTSAEEGAALLNEVAAATRLAEGPEGVRRILRSVFRGQPIPLRDLSRDVALPVPVVAAVRGELESRGLLARGAGVVLTENGAAFVRKGLGLSCRERFRELEPDAVASSAAELLNPMRSFCAERPAVDVTLDQSHATPETALRRALYLLEIDALEGRDLLILGDDDLTSLAVTLVARHFDLRMRRLAVLEIDARLVAYLTDAHASLGASLPAEIRSHDLREPLPDGFGASFDAFLTDPPYTMEGLSLFLSRGVSALRAGASRPAVLCFGHRMPDEAAEALRRVTAMGLAPFEIIRGFNHYVGAQVLAGTSQLMRLMTTTNARPEVTGAHDGRLYTAQGRPPRSGRGQPRRR